MSTSQIQSYKFHDSPFRGFIRATDGTVCFIAKDATDILGTRTDHIADILDDDEYGEIANPHNMGVAQNGGRKPLYVTEAGLYRLVLRSRKPEAHEFQRWVTHEVLPQIRRTGGYIPKAETPEETMARAVLIAQKTIKEQKEQLEAQAPKVLFADTVSAAKTDILVGDLAKILRQNGYQTGQNRLFKQWMGEHVIFRKNVSAHHYEYRPTQASLEAGWFKLVGHVYISSDGKHESLTLMVTPRGQRHFLTKYLKDMPALSINAQEAE